MSKYMERVRDMLCDELDEIAEKGELTAGNLEAVDKLTHSIKSIDTILAMKEAEGYSEGYEPHMGTYRDTRGVSYGRKRDSMGRYSRRGYSYADDGIIEEMRDMMSDLPADKQREFQRLLDRMK